ncbi:MAG: tRNA (adenosine(37)-N6)-threonylcarbamoyltransferase complex transferase subunit TsaD [Candidatus Omnitrophota bacterium]
MLTLGIETSCDETGVSVTEGRKVLSNIVSSSVHLHKRYGGVVPEIASRYHVEYILEVLSEALKVSGRPLKDIKLVTVTNGPGLVGSLLTGISLAKSLSYALGMPLVGVNHVLAHLYSAFLNEGRRPEFPFVGLVVSGGHTALFYCEDIGRQKLIGQTQDDAVGEAYDKVAKMLGLGYPGGPAVEKRARLAGDRKRVVFPRSYLGKDSLDFSFSGVKTAVLYYIQKLRAQSPKLKATIVDDVCYAFQEAVLDVLVEKANRACEAKRTDTMIVGGGVAINSRLREKFRDSSGRRGTNVYFPEAEYCMDNAAMVGVLGEALYRKGERSDLYLSAQPNLEVN